MLIYLHKLNIEIQRGRFLLPMTNYILIQCAQKEDFKVITCFGILEQKKETEKGSWTRNDQLLLFLYHKDGEKYTRCIKFGENVICTRKHCGLFWLYISPE